jgi:hypothetical protein
LGDDVATTTIKDYIVAKKAQLAALMDGGDKLFNSVWIGPNTEIGRLLNFNRTPMAIISDQGGEIQMPNQKIWDRSFGVTVVVNRPRDAVGQQSAIDLLDIGDKLLAALTNDRSDSAVFCYLDTEEFMVTTETGNLFVAKTWYFNYSIEVA